MARAVLIPYADRADRAIATALGISRARVDALLLAGGARANGHRLKKGDRIEAGVTIEVDAGPLEEQAALVAEPDAPLRVLLERPGLVVLDKPAGQPSHPLQPGETGTLANALVARYPEVEAVGAAPREGGLCHRLDTETSGAILAARSGAAFDDLRMQFRSRTVRKVYLAVVRGVPAEPEGRIDLPLTGRGKTKLWRAEHDGRSVPAITTYKLVEARGALAVIEVIIETGVRHQIRVHLAAIGHPLAGDALYGGGELLPGQTRHLLHAWKLGFVEPTTGEAVEVVAPVPFELG